MPGIHHSLHQSLRLAIITAVICLFMTSISQPIGAAVTSDVLPQAKTELPSSLDDALKSLHRALNDNKKAIPALMDSIQRLKDRANSQPPLAKALVYDTIATMYETLDMDSCITYYRIGEEAARIGGDSILAQRMRLHIFADMPVTGVVLEGYNGFMDESSRIYPQNRMAYFEAGNKMMLYIADLYARIPTPRLRNAFDSLQRLAHINASAPQPTPYPPHSPEI